MRAHLASTIVLALTALAGCQGTPPAPTAQPAPAPTTRPVVMDNMPRPEPKRPVVHLDVYQMAVPRGAVSRSAEFWKRVDEQQIDPPTYDLLLKNGVRVGVAPTRDWDYFRDVLERNNARTAWGSVMAGGSGTMDLPMRKNIPSQDIFYVGDAAPYPIGRTYPQCENLFGLSFWPDQRQEGALHLTVTPVVRATRGRLEYHQGEEQEFVYVRPESLYELNLRAVIPPGWFLVIGPSPESRWPTSLGNAFLTLDGDADEKEQVLILVPHTVRPGDPANATPPPAGVRRRSPAGT